MMMLCGPNIEDMGQVVLGKYATGVPFEHAIISNRADKETNRDT